ncbi:MAG: CHASE domain-containing protein [Ignavibacteria bacterium]
MSVGDSNNMYSNSVLDFIKKSFRNRSVWQMERKRIWPALVLLTGGLLLTLAAGLTVKNFVEKDANKEFNYVCSELQNKISARLRTHAQLLRSWAAFFENSDEVTWSKWQNFSANQMIEKNSPGIYGAGYAVIIPQNQLVRHEKKIRSEGFPQYSVRPEGKREIYTPVMYTEPFLSTLGYDMFSEPVRKKAMETARDHNTAYLSEKVTLTQETNEDIQTGTLMYVPVYKRDMPGKTIEERRRAIQGWVFIAYRMNVLMRGILEEPEFIKIKHIRMEIFDDSSFSRNVLLYDNKKIMDENITSSSSFSLKTHISFNGSLWYLRFSQYDSFAPDLDYSNVWLIAAGGISISILLFVVYLLLINTNIKAHKLAEKLTQDLRESETKYSSIISNISDVVCITGVDGILKYNSPNVEKWFGWQPQDLTGTNGWLTIHPDDLERIQEEFFSLLEKDNSVKITEYRFKCKDGSYKPVHLTATNLINDPVINGILINYRDVTERKQAEDALQESEQKYRTLADSGSTLVWASGTDKLCYYFNRVWFEFTGRTPEQEMGNGWAEGVHPEDFQRCLDIYIVAFDRQEKFSMDYRLKRYDGQYRWIQDDGCPSYNSTGSFTGYIGHCIDITERKQAEEALKKSIQRLDLAMKTANMTWWEIDRTTGNVIFEKGKAEMLGFPPEKFKHYTDFTALLHPDDYENAMNTMRRHIEGLSDKYEIEYRMLTSSNKYKWFYDIGVITEVDSNGHPVKIIGIALDISERKTAELELVKLNEDLQTSKIYIEENFIQEHALVGELTLTKEKLEKINSEKDKLFSIIAHDLRSPFQGLLGVTEMMAENINNFSKDELSNATREMYITSRNVFTLLNNLLEWARMQQGMISFTPTEIVLSELVFQNIELLIKRGEQKGIEIVHKVDQSQTVNADEAMLNTILRNLLSNAVKFTKQGGKIIVRAEETGNNMVKISVTDSGIGMPEALTKKLFNVAEKVGRKGTDGESSTGLGLLLCKEFVERHGGRIWVESEEKKGTTFYFTLIATD